jgi:predicted metallo-beta-lactamase superfamily hydrolase
LGIKFEFAGAESLGVRSLATYVRTPDVKVLVDAGASLGMRSYLLPHPLEYKALRETKDRIVKYAQKADCIAISHYHFDHYIATWKEVDAVWSWSSYEQAKEVYGNKTVYAKAFRKNINISQRKRGYFFGKIAADFCKEIVYADDEEYKFGATTITFSPPLHHGDDNSLLGYVLGTLISYDEQKFLHCASSEKTLKFILKIKPDFLVLSGPPMYLSGTKIEPDIIQKGLRNLSKIVKNIKNTIVDHHLLRSEEGLNVIKELKVAAKENGNNVNSIAEFMGKENYFLEAKRKKLYAQNPPDAEFQKWLKMKPAKQSTMLPPV